MPRKAKGTLASIGAMGPSSAVGYVRVSTEEQATGGVSLEAQEERLRAYCVGAGLQLATVVREEGVSGAKSIADRPSGARLLQLLGARKAQNVVALKLDRLFRSAVDALNQTKRWDDAGVTLHLVDMGGTAINTRSAIGRLMLTMMAAFAELERNMIAERTTTAMRHMKAKRAAYSPVPLGFARVGDDLIEDPREMATVARIQEFRTLGWNYSRIADHLNAQKVPTKRGGKWWAASIRYILKNDLYDGVRDAA